jgi:CheY-like chemotaxis protein
MSRLLIALCQPRNAGAAIWMAAALTISCSAALAQQDPFSGDSFSNDPFGMSDAADSSSAARQEDSFGFGRTDLPRDVSPSAPLDGESGRAAASANDPLILMLNERPPTTPSEVGRFLGWMTQLEHWPQVGVLLDKVSGSSWDLNQKADVAKAAGQSAMRRLRAADVPLSETQRSTADEIHRAPSELASNAQVINQRIDQLKDENPAVRRMAQLRLQDGGSEALIQLARQLLQEKSSVPPVMLAGTINEFGREGINLLREASFISNPETRRRILLALAEVPGNSYSLELASALVGQISEPALVSELADTLGTRFTRLPTSDSVRQHLITAFDNALLEYRLASEGSTGAISGRIEDDLLTDRLWLPSAGGDSITPHPATKQMLTLSRLSQIGWMLGQLQTADRSDTLKAGTISLQRLYHFGQKGAEQDDASLLDSFPQEELEDPDYWIGVFNLASEWEMHGAAVMAIQKMVDLKNLSEKSTSIDFLSRSLFDSRPAIRYAALEAIALIDPQDDYSGSERALTTALEMLKLGSGPQALIVGSNFEISKTAEALLSQQTNIESIVLTSGRETLLSLSASNPADLLVIVDRVQDLSLFELMQRIRNTQGGGQIPIAVMIPELARHERQWIDKTPGVITGVLSRQDGEVGRQLQALMDSMEVLPLTNQQRSRYSEIAEQFITRIAEDRNTYAFYPFDQWRSFLVNLTSSASALAHSQVLSSLSSPEGQQRLVQLVAAAGVAESERHLALRGFERSVQKHGLLLNRQDIQLAYDLYNRLGPNDAGIAKVMGELLDLIENSMRP